MKNISIIILDQINRINLLLNKFKPENAELNLNTHLGQEFNYVLKGKLKIHLGGKEMILEEGDSIYFNSGLPHGMVALDGNECKFLAVIF